MAAFLRNLRELPGTSLAPAVGYGAALAIVLVGFLARLALQPLFGASHVTRHDAVVSIAAGFRAGELPELLGFDDGNWDYRCHTTALGAYRMVAIRRP